MGSETIEREGAAMETSAAAEGPRKVILFSVGRELFALSLEDLAEIYNIDEITHLPLSPDFLVGVINVHGNLASVISLSEVLSIADAKMSHLVLLLVPGKGGFAIQVDRTIGFGSYDVLEEVTRDAARRRGKISFIEGVFRDGEELYSLISTEKLRIWIDGEFTKGED